MLSYNHPTYLNYLKEILSLVFESSELFDKAKELPSDTTMLPGSTGSKGNRDRCHSHSH